MGRFVQSLFLWQFRHDRVFAAFETFWFVWLSAGAITPGCLRLITVESDIKKKHGGTVYYQSLPRDKLVLDIVQTRLSVSQPGVLKLIMALGVISTPFPR